MINPRYRGMTQRQVWDKMVETYGPDVFYAESPTPATATLMPVPRPHQVPHLYSGCPNKRGQRIWAFRTREERDKFIQTYPEAKGYIGE